MQREGRRREALRLDIERLELELPLVHLLLVPLVREDPADPGRGEEREDDLGAPADGLAARERRAGVQGAHGERATALEPPHEGLLLDPVLEGLAAIDVDDRHVVLEALEELGVALDVHLDQLEGNSLPHLRKNRLGLVAERAIGLAVDLDLDHGRRRIADPPKRKRVAVARHPLEGSVS